LRDRTRPGLAGFAAEISNMRIAESVSLLCSSVLFTDNDALAETRHFELALRFFAELISKVSR
jgi:hypothetical protein